MGRNELNQRKQNVQQYLQDAPLNSGTLFSKLTFCHNVWDMDILNNPLSPTQKVFISIAKLILNP